MNKAVLAAIERKTGIAGDPIASLEAELSALRFIRERGFVPLVLSREGGMLRFSAVHRMQQGLL